MEKSEDIEIHFVVKYDTETETFAVDYETQDAMFHEGAIYDNGLSCWRRPADDELDNDDSEYCRSADRLFVAVERLNGSRVRLPQLDGFPIWKNLTQETE
jgi:hypothetical protein